MRKIKKFSTYQKRIKDASWLCFAQRDPADFPLLIVSYFFVGHQKYLGFKKLLYLNKDSKIFGYKDGVELKKIYQKIGKFKKSNLLFISEETKNIVEDATLLLWNISSKNLAGLNNLELRNYFHNLTKVFNKFAGYFVYSQYIGQAFQNNPKILKYFDKKTIQTIRFKPMIPGILEKLKIFLKIVSQRKSINTNMLFWSFPEEIEKLLTTKNRKYCGQLKKQLKSRKNYYLWVLFDNKQYFYIDYKDKEIIKNLFKPDISDAEKNVITGKSARSGKTQGKVKIVLSRKDFRKFNKGDILVSVMTMPYYLPIFKKANAVVTDEGGLLCHASIMAREMKKPCIIGTKIATKVLKDGDLVEVDANRGIVRILKRSKTNKS